MLSISIGPLALPVAPLLLLAAVWLASWLAGRWAARLAGQELSKAAGNAVFHAALQGLLAARLVHLALHAGAYLTAPLAALDIRDGGWHAPSGALAGAAWLAWRGHRWPLLRGPLAGAAAVAAALWFGATVVTGLGQAREMPAVTPSATYIASKGIPRARITGKGYGDTKLLNGCACEGKLTSNCTEEDHALNRRTEFIVTKYKEIPKK